MLTTKRSDAVQMPGIPGALNPLKQRTEDDTNNLLPI
jgi:hypothetical protein